MRSFQYADLPLWEEEERLAKRAEILEERHYRWQDKANDYEAATEVDPTPEQEAHLDRLIAVSNRAHDLWESLLWRAEKIKAARALLEEAQSEPLDRAAARGRERVKRKAASV